MRGIDRERQRRPGQWPLPTGCCRWRRRPASAASRCSGGLARGGRSTRWRRMPSSCRRWRSRWHLQAVSRWRSAWRAVGVTRITAPGAMSSPEAGWHHDGGFNLPAWCGWSRSRVAPNVQRALRGLRGGGSACELPGAEAGGLRLRRLAANAATPSIWMCPKGEIHCIVGRSGCGKTTLLKLAAGLLAPLQGRVEPARPPACRGQGATSASSSRRRPCSSGSG